MSRSSPVDRSLLGVAALVLVACTSSITTPGAPDAPTGATDAADPWPDGAARPDAPTPWIDAPPAGECSPATVGQVCRPATGACDVAETCEAGSTACPPDALAPPGTPCRGAADLCDAPEACTGASPACPADELLGGGVECRPASGIACDAPETCTGGSSACPPDGPDACQLTYVVVPHPDDEYEAWSLVEDSPANYTVFVLLTTGEQTGYCVAWGTGACQTTTGGPKAYQGPGSPVGEPDYGEWVYGDPWQGRWTAACKAARLASYHRFLDDMALADASLPYAPTEIGTFSIAGNTSAGVPPQRIDGSADGCGSTTPVTSRDAQVFVGDKGARIIFDLGDGDLTTPEVLWALDAVRANRLAWGIPDLPEYAVIGAAFYNATAVNSGVAMYPSCDYYGHGDHRAIHEALWNTNLGAGAQWVRACDTDPDVTNTGGRTDWVTSATHDYAFRATATTRVGKSTIAYGWLADPYYAGCESVCGFSRKQSFWRR